jgi:hypothetical protein
MERRLALEETLDPGENATQALMRGRWRVVVPLLMDGFRREWGSLR